MFYNYYFINHEICRITKSEIKKNCMMNTLSKFYGHVSICVKSVRIQRQQHQINKR